MYLLKLYSNIRKIKKIFKIKIKIKDREAALESMQKASTLKCLHYNINALL